MKKTILVFVVLVAGVFAFTSCKEVKKEDTKTESHEHNGDAHEHDSDSQEAIETAHLFQCPMDCEKGKTYEEKGSCPVCKMDLKELKTDKNEHTSNCKCKEGGECTCPEGKCECKKEEVALKASSSCSSKESCGSMRSCSGGLPKLAEM